MNMIVEPVLKEFYLDGEDEPPTVIGQVKVVTLHGDQFLDPDQVINLIHDLESALVVINTGE